MTKSVFFYSCYYYNYYFIIFQLMTKLVFMLNAIAPIVTASFFVIAIAEWFYKLLHFVRNDKKDIVESGMKLLKKQRDIGRPTSLYILEFRNIFSVKSVVEIYRNCVFINFFTCLFKGVSKRNQVQNSTARGNHSVASVICASI